METLLSLFFIITFFFTFTILVAAADTCKPASCGNSGPEVRFPFWLTGHQPPSCGYPGFDLSCNNMSQLILNLPFTGVFVVSRIDYSSQAIYFDFDFCTKNSIKVAINLSQTPFDAPYERSYTFLKCPSTQSSNIFFPMEPIDCLSRDNDTVAAIPTYFYNQYSTNLPSDCKNISTLGFPTQRNAMFLEQDFRLAWGPPYCGRCELQGGTCGFKNGSTLEVACSSPPHHGKLLPSFLKLERLYN